MAKDIDQTIYLKDYTPPAYLIDKTELTFHLDPTKTRVSSRIAFRPNPDAKTNQFILDGAEMKLIWAKINGAPVSPNIAETHLDCVVPNAPFIWEAEVEINPRANTALDGPNNLEFSELTALLLKGPPLKTYTITIPEGLWISETLETISAQTGYEVIQLENSLKSGKVISQFHSDNDYVDLQNWEGLLFPNTYQINIDANGEEILQTLVDELELRYNNIISNNNLPTWINDANEFFTIASLIEAESKIDEDRPLVSSVIKNRLEIDMLLQIDASILYALQKRKSQVLLIDYK